jgi:hypothetical protein
LNENGTKFEKNLNGDGTELSIPSSNSVKFLIFGELIPDPYFTVVKP